MNRMNLFSFYFIYECTKAQIKEFKTVIGNIVTDILMRITRRFLNYLKTQKHASHIFSYSDELKQILRKFKFVNLHKIYISPNKHSPCKDEKCSNIITKISNVLKILKVKPIFIALLIYYIKFLILTLRIMTAVDPENNMCLRRLNA